MKTTLTEVKKIIAEEVYAAKLSLIEADLNSTFNKIKTQTVLREGILSSIISLFLEPKVKKDAEALKKSPEYKELIRQIEVSTKELNKLTDRLKRRIEDHQENIESMQKAGIKVKSGMTPDQMWNAYKKWQTDRNTAFSKKWPDKDKQTWEKYLKS